jgi:hypothetical protein
MYEFMRSKKSFRECVYLFREMYIILIIPTIVGFGLMYMSIVLHLMYE